MALKSDAHRYGSVARAMHWISALAILAMLGSGLAADSASGQSEAVTILRFHAVTGVSILILTVLRILWWVFADRWPGDTAQVPRWQALAARGVHLGFYVVIILLAGSGMATLALSGGGDVLSGASAGPMPDFENFAPRAPHGLLAWVLVGLLALHLGAALYHQFVLKDRLLGRMGLGKI